MTQFVTESPLWLHSFSFKVFFFYEEKNWTKVVKLYR